MNIKKLYPVLFIILAIVFICISVSIFVVFVAHTCCEPAVCLPCLSVAKIQEIVRQFATILATSVVLLTAAWLIQTTIYNVNIIQCRANLVLLKARLNN